jgi:hypothetical protein
MDSPPLPETPDLRIISLEAVREHEYNDDQRTGPLVRRLQMEGLLKNPPLVAPLDPAPATVPPDLRRYVVLDGANRCTALEQLGYPHILVQVVKYEPPQVTLSTWHHAVTGLEPERIARGLDAIDGLDVHLTDTLSARAGLARREFIAYVMLADGRVLAARAKAHSLHVQNRLLNALVDTYKLHGGLYRTVAHDLQELHSLYADLTALVVFPNYEPAEVLALARDGELLPPGLTRHLVQGRVLRTNYPLAELRTPDPLDVKNARLHAWLQAKLAEREVRFYGEGTFLFDE